MKRRLKGQVVSKQDKTVAVRVERSKNHPIYRKRFVSSNKFLAHDEIGVAEGDFVVIEETKPISKKKNWIVLDPKKVKEDK